MKIRLILISSLLSVLPLIFFQIYHYYSTERIELENHKREKVLELRNSSEDISDNLQKALDTLSLLTQLTLPKISLEFKRPEAVTEFLKATRMRSSYFEDLVILDKDFEYFASDSTLEDVFTLIYKNKNFKDIASSMASGLHANSISYKNNDHASGFYVASRITNDSGDVIGYLIGNIKKSLIEYALDRLSQRTSLRSVDSVLIGSSIGNLHMEYKCESLRLVNTANPPSLCLRIADQPAFTNTFRNITILFLTFCLLVALYALIYKFIFDRIFNPLHAFLKNLNRISDGDYRDFPENSKYGEINSFISLANTIVKKLDVYRADELLRARNQAVAKVAAQAAHDIRSPLEMLKSMKQEISQLPDDIRRKIGLGINRIEEITYGLLKDYKQSSNIEAHMRSENLLVIINSVVIEKSIEYRKFNNISIVKEIDANAYGLFSKIERVTFKNILSNLLNNSVDSIGDEKSEIQISLSSDFNSNFVTIRDLGQGMSSDVLLNIYTQGFTTKAKGNGLGLHNAKNEIEKMGGVLEIESKIGVGTKVIISLPKSEPNLSFVDSLNIARYKKVIVLDDDFNFHEVWKRKLQNYLHMVEFFYSPNDLFEKYRILDSDILLLTDFELLEGLPNGVEVILHYQNADSSIIVSALAEEPFLENYCATHGIKKLNKSMIDLVPVRSYASSFSDEIKVVLIDDDKFIRANWSSYCQKNKIPFEQFQNVDEFLSASLSINKRSLVFIDCQLSETRGDIDSERISILGFKNLHLATGYDQTSVEKPAWIRTVNSKSPQVIELLLYTVND